MIPDTLFVTETYFISKISSDLHCGLLFIGRGFEVTIEIHFHHMDIRASMGPPGDKTRMAPLPSKLLTKRQLHLIVAAVGVSAVREERGGGLGHFRDSISFSLGGGKKT